MRVIKGSLHYTNYILCSTFLFNLRIFVRINYFHTSRSTLRFCSPYICTIYIPTLMLGSLSISSTKSTLINRYVKQSCLLHISVLLDVMTNLESSTGITKRFDLRETTAVIPLVFHKYK